MKTTLLTTALLAAAAAFAQTLTVNQILTVNQTLAGPLTNADDTTTEVTIAGASAIAEGATTVLEATLSFTLPSADPEFGATVTEKDRLVIAAKADGTGLLVSDAKAWTTLGVSVSENKPIAVRAEATLADDGASVKYRVSVGETFVTVTRPNTAAPTAIALEGVGSASALALKQVSTDVLPPAPGGSQGAALVDKYVAWENDATKGGALKDATDAAERLNAFAMNVGGTPKLEVVAIDTADRTDRTITLRGSYVPASADGTQTLSEPTTADLTAINGVLTITAQDSLSGAKTTYNVKVTADDGELVKVRFPKTARFVKATVDVYAPADAAADSIEGIPVSETTAAQ